MQIKKFSQNAQKVLLSCRAIAQKNSNHHVEPEHLAFALIMTAELKEVLSSKKVDQGALEQDLLKLISKLPASPNSEPVFSVRLMQALSAALALSLAKGHNQVFVSDILFSLLENKDKFSSLGAVLAKYFLNQDDELRSEQEQNKSFLSTVTENLCDLYRKKELDPAYGREKELLRLIQILSRKTSYNPLLIGPAGVGKSSIIRCLIKKIVDQEVPSHIIGKEIIQLDMSSLLVNTSLRGQLEEKIRLLLQELAEKKGQYILLIKDISLLMNDGSLKNTSKLLEPALLKGNVQIIALVTPKDYKIVVEPDKAFNRFFQPLWIEQPSVEECEDILLKLKHRLENFHGVFIDNDAITAAIDLGSRHLTDRVLPEVALDLLDEACSHHRIKIDQIKNNKNCQKELSIIESMRAIKAELVHSENPSLLKQFKQYQKKLDQRKKKLIDPFVRRNDIATIISQETGIPVKKMVQSEKDKLFNMESILSQSVIGQEEAIVAVSNAIRRARVGLKDPRKPIGSFLFLGPTGVGKTELARTLTNFLFDDERAMIRFDMSEFMERHSVARLIGAPPGYKGADDGGQLTESVRRKPYSVVLFDEIEKAHGDILNILLQVLDDGRLTDSKGNLVHFNNTVIIMTSNIGADILLSKDYEKNKPLGQSRLMDRLLTHIRPELLNRIDEIVYFNPMSLDSLNGIMDIMIESLTQRVNKQGFDFFITDDAKSFIIKNGFSREFGARPLKRSVQKLIENPLSMAILSGQFKNKKTIEVGVSKGNIIFS